MAPAGQFLVVQGRELGQGKFADFYLLPKPGAVAVDHLLAGAVPADQKWVSPAGPAIDPDRVSVLLVEGLEDVAYLLSCLNLLDKADEFRRLGGHIVAANGKSELLRPLVIARHMRIPTYVIFDADADKPDKNGSRAKHEKDNSALLAILGKAGDDPLPVSRTRFPWTQNWLNRSVQGGPEHDR